MRLIEALQVLNRPAPIDAPVLRVFLGCGFTPSHLQTFTAAHLREAHPECLVRIESGPFGDLPGGLERLNLPTVDAVAVVIEWPDLDSRLGIRELGGWRETDVSDILRSVVVQVDRLEQALTRLAHTVPCVCVLPTLPLPPLFPPPPGASGGQELELRALVATLASTLARAPGLTVLSAQELDRVSRMQERADVKAAILSGFPYTLEHAAVLGKLISDLLKQRSPKKGLITDLDDTLWAGVLGEIGVDHIGWTLAERAQVHGIYQQFLGSLASIGVLIAVASKNDPTLVARAFERQDLLLRKDDVFPFEVHWSRKSESVARILAAWNVGPEAVVFVDDSPLEVAEVKAAFPEMECRVFPKDDHDALLGVLRELRDWYGKHAVSEEDRLRADSIRRSSAARRVQQPGDLTEDDFLRGTDALVVFEGPRSDITRAFELLNKTNQFNLNGRRLDQAAWNRYLSQDGAFILTVRYEDKYSRLGLISVVLGNHTGSRLRVGSWVMSCRAFSRRIEHQFLRFLFEKFDAHEIEFDYQETPRNQPVQQFLRAVAGREPFAGLLLSRDECLKRIPLLFHRIEDRT